MALLIVLLGTASVLRTAVDIFPSIAIPVVSIVWSYPGIAPQDMANRIATISERAVTTTVNDVEHIESQSLPGVTVIKVFLHPHAKVEAGIAQITAVQQTLLRVLPPGTTPPFIIAYNASTVPILQLVLDSKTLSEQQLFDLGQNFVRTQLATVQGAALPHPFGGKARQIMVDLDPAALRAHGLTPLDVSSAVSAQNLFLPSGAARLGNREYAVRLNGSTDSVEELNDLPIREEQGRIIRMRDVAHVRDGAGVQTSIVTVNGRRSALLTVLKNGNASTLDVIRRVKERLPAVLNTLPKELNIRTLVDQSIFVRAAVEGVIREAVIAALLTALMIWLFLGDWQSTLVVVISIPLSIMCSLALLGMAGHTLNVMTLGGLALAVGILVDDATVELENIHRNVEEEGLSLSAAVIHGWHQIAAPTLISTTAICLVFVSVVFLTGPARFLFSPLGLAVVFAMAASYLLSRTLVPVIAYQLLTNVQLGKRAPSSRAARFARWFEEHRTRYGAVLAHLVEQPRRAVRTFALLAVWSACLLPWIGRDFFPSVDAGTFRLGIRAAPGARLETTSSWFVRVERLVRDVIPPHELDVVLCNVGLASAGPTLAFTDSASIGVSSGEMLVSLAPGHGPTAGYVEKIRARLASDLPQLTCFFQPADIVNQILNFGLPAPIDIQVVGKDPKNAELAQAIAKQVRRIPGAVDVRVHEQGSVPQMQLDVDRIRAASLGAAQREIASNLLVALASSGQASPSYWLDPATGVSYPIAVQAPPYRLQSSDAILDLPVTSLARSGTPQLLRNVATARRTLGQANVDHYNVQPVHNVYAGVAGTDLGRVVDGVSHALAAIARDLPRGTQLKVRGQALSMQESFEGLSWGLGFAVLLIYLLLVVSFQSWSDPLIIISALPGALFGVVWALFATCTTFSVPSLMGTIMSLGVATANSVLVVTFANEQLRAGATPAQAALAAGMKRLRPVLMTAAAMVLGMLPMALGLGEGGEQNAPLGRAVVGGLLAATATTLFLVPALFSLKRAGPTHQGTTALQPAETLTPAPEGAADA